MELSHVTSKGQITLPASIRKKTGLARGDAVTFALTKAGILVKPVIITDKTKTPAWKRALNAALADARTGRGAFHENTEAFMRALK